MTEERQEATPKPAPARTPGSIAPAAVILAGARFSALTTFRRDGAAVETPVWFALSEQTVYIMTGATSGKVKRLRHTPEVTLAPCSARGAITGPTLVGRARILTDPKEIAHARHALRRAYGLLYRIVMILGAIRRIVQPGARQSTAYLAIDLAPDASGATA